MLDQCVCLVKLLRVAQLVFFLSSEDTAAKFCVTSEVME